MSPELDLEAELDRLYAAPPGDFVGLRGDLAKQARLAGQREAAAQIKARRKPSPTAWAVNCLALREDPHLEEILASGDHLKKLIQDGASADAQLGAGARRRAAIEAAVIVASDLLREQALPPTPATLRRLAKTFEAMAAFGRAPPGPAPGRMFDELDPPGFEVLATVPLTPAAKPVAVASPRSPRSSGPAKALLEGLRSELSSAEAALSQVLPKIEAAEVEIADAKGSVKQAQRDLTKSEARLKRANEALEKARRKLAVRETEVEERTRALERATEGD